MRIGKHDLLAMFRTLGPPAFFITLTADDMNWPDLLYVLAKRAGMDITVEDVDNLNSGVDNLNSGVSKSVNCCVVIRLQQLDISHNGFRSS